MIYIFSVSIALGITFEKYFGFGYHFGLLVLILSGILFFHFKREKYFFAKAALVFGVAFFAGAVRLGLADLSADAGLSRSVGEKVDFRAAISREPDERDESVRYVVRPEGSQSSVLLVADRFPRFSYGDKIQVSGKLVLPENFVSDSGAEFDYVSYLGKDKIHFLIYRPQIDLAVSSSTGLHWTMKMISSLYSLKNIFIKNISAVVPEPNASLLGGIIFGAKQSLGEDLLADFREAGLIHIVVLSGYNITIIAAGIFYAVSFLGKRSLSLAVSAVSIFLFAVMVGLGSTVVRACVMALIALLAIHLGRPKDAMRALFVAGLFMVIWNPLIVSYDPSFQLSFLATLGLVAFTPFVHRFISESRLRQVIPQRFALREMVASTISVQLFVLPLLVRISGQISLVSFLVNPIILPFVPLSMGFGAMTGALGLLPFVGYILSWPLGVVSYLITQVIISITELAVRLPLASIKTGAIPLWLIAAWYLIYGLLYLKFRKKVTLYQ